MRKSITLKSTNISEEESSNDGQASTNEDSEMTVGEQSVDDDNVMEDDLDASVTDSDVNGSDTDSDVEDIRDSELTAINKSKAEKIKESIMQRYQERQGKQLYIRFPHKVPETLKDLEQKIRELTPLAVKVRKPRQRHSRFCLVDFATNDDRDSALNNLKKSIKKGDLNKYVVNTPRTESADFVQKLVERKIKSIENNKVKRHLKKASKKTLTEKNYTSTVIVLNLPRNVSILQIRELFANAVDINIRPSKGKYKSIAAITFPTTFDARNAIRKKVSLGGNELSLRFDNKLFKKDTKKSSKNCESSEDTKLILNEQKSESSIQNVKRKESSSNVIKPNLNENKRFKKDANTVSKKIRSIHKQNKLK